MPVNRLYCEGASKSPDIGVIRSLLAGISTDIKPVGTKSGLEKRILGARDVIPSSAGIRDRDFDNDENIPTGSPRNWSIQDNQNTVLIGWSWERKEIENYLIDPQVVNRALGSQAPSPNEYHAALQTSAEEIADYTAARTALSVSRIQPLPIKNLWGRRRGRDRYRFPDMLRENDCRTAITDIVDEYELAQSVKVGNVLSPFDQLLLACRPGGARFQDFLTFFAGRDLLYGMEARLTDFGFASAIEFRTRVLEAITESTEDVWTWLPEWQRLRELINSFGS